MKIRLLVNPMAGAGKAAGRARQAVLALRAAGVEAELDQTQRPGHATDLARRAFESGVDCIGVVGGDGTINEVARAYLGADGTPVSGPGIALFPAGTGGDFRKTFRISNGVDAAVQRVLRAEPRPLDLGVATFSGHDGKPRTLAWVNILSFGVGGLTDQLVNRGGKWMGGRAAFFLGALRATLSYPNLPVRVTVDERPWLERRVANVAIANGRFFGGGMEIAPAADPSDGQLDIVAIGDVSVAESLALAPSLYRGRHLDHPKVRSTRGAHIHAEALRGEVPIDLDGENPGRLPLDVRVLPGALRLFA